MNIKYDQAVMEIIKKRSSRRTYRQGELDEVLQQYMMNACLLANTGLFGESIRFTLVDKGAHPADGVKLGDYGMFKNARYFILGRLQDTHFARVSYGYALESLVLKANDLGLGTCWIGVFNQAYFSDVQMQEGEIIPAICVLGEAQGRRLIEQTARLAVGATRRKPWSELFFWGNFVHPLDEQQAGVYRDILEMVRLAPSAGNAQPCRVVMDATEEKFHFYLKPVRQAYFQKGLHHVDLGIAMCHFECSARECGFVGKWIETNPGIQTESDMEYIASWVRNQP